jgi:hypothetical protein
MLCSRFVACLWLATASCIRGARRLTKTMTGLGPMLSFREVWRWQLDLRPPVCCRLRKRTVSLLQE